MVHNSNFPIVVTGSILDCSIWQLSEKLTSALHGGLQHLHLDIIDGRFAPRITYGVQMIQDLHQRFPTLSIACHFMVDLILIKDLNRYFFPYLLSPAQTLIVQLASFSGEQQIQQFLNLKKKYAIRLGLAIALPILLKDYQK